MHTKNIVFYFYFIKTFAEPVKQVFKTALLRFLSVLIQIVSGFRKIQNMKNSARNAKVAQHAAESYLQVPATAD